MRGAPDERDDELPQLTADIVADEQELAQAVDALIGRDPEFRRQVVEISQHMEWLKAAVDPDAWKLALRIEELCSGRWADALVKTASWRAGQSLRDEEESS